MGKFKCQMCPVTHTMRNKAVLHAINAHSHEAQFQVTCMFPGCIYSSKSWSTFRKHCIRKHGVKNVCQLAEIISEEENLTQPEVDPELESALCSSNTHVHSESTRSTIPVKTLMSKFVLSLEAKHHMTRKGLAEIAGTMEDLTEQLSMQVQQQVRQALRQDSNADVCAVIQESCKIDLQELSNDRGRHSIYTRKFSYLQPEPVHEGNKAATIGYYVPLESLLQLLCRQDQVWACMSKKIGTNKQGSLMRDFEDGEIVKNHPIPADGDIFLQFALYYDDLELQNPLRSNKKHKLAMFYMSILNIPPVYRSRLQNIFAVAIAPVHKVKKHGFLLVLQDFLDTMRKLRCEGIFVTGRNTLVRGDLIAVLCDTPAAAAIGGFKESSSFSHHFCRSCMASKDTFMHQRFEEEVALRDMEKYNQHCLVLDNTALKNRREFWSKTYGVNGRSCLCAIPDFDVCKSLLQDPMHVILEGCLPYVLALFLQYSIFQTQKFTLQMLNDYLLESCKVLQERKDVVMTIEAKHIKKDEHIKQKASSMLVMAYILPLFLGQYLDERDERYNNLLSLIRITCMCFNPVCDETTAGVLAQEIASFLDSFCKVYSTEKVRPKMHFMLHFPRQLKMFGPLRHHSTMRAEAKHQAFKDHRWMDFNNLPLSLLKRHQVCLANALTDNTGNITANFLQEANEVTSKWGQAVKVMDLAENIKAELMQNLQLQEEDVLVEYSLLTWRGRQYGSQCCLLISESEEGGPIFGKIVKLYPEENTCYASIEQVETHEFVAAFNAYKITVSGQGECFDLVDLAKMQMNWPLPMHTVNGSLYVVNRYGLLS